MTFDSTRYNPSSLEFSFIQERQQFYNSRFETSNNKKKEIKILKNTIASREAQALWKQTCQKIIYNALNPIPLLPLACTLTTLEGSLLIADLTGLLPAYPLLSIIGTGVITLVLIGEYWVRNRNIEDLDLEIKTFELENFEDETDLSFEKDLTTLELMTETSKLIIDNQSFLNC